MPANCRNKLLGSSKLRCFWEGSEGYVLDLHTHLNWTNQHPGDWMSPTEVADAAEQYCRVLQDILSEFVSLHNLLVHTVHLKPNF